MKPFSQACENNKKPILDCLGLLFKTTRQVLEIGSGTGQHAVYFAKHLPHLFWQTTDQAYYLPGIEQWIREAELPNLYLPLELNVLQDTHWRKIMRQLLFVDGIFSANTAHIMSWQAVQATFKEVSQLLHEDGLFILYGPFNRNGTFTSSSNQRFHESLILQNPEMGIRNDQAIFDLADSNAFLCTDDINMPANNRILVFQKTSTKCDPL